MIGHGRHSTTERVSVRNEEFISSDLAQDTVYSRQRQRFRVVSKYSMILRGNAQWRMVEQDEMNIIIVMDQLSLAELKYISAIHTRIISASNGKLAITQVQDSVLGGYNLTVDNECRFDQKFIRRLHQNSRIVIENERFGKGSISGKQVLSLVLPKFNYKDPTFFYDKEITSFDYTEDHKALQIELGEIVSGTFDEKASNFQKILSQNNNHKLALDHNYSIQQVILKYNEYNGHTMSIRDFIQTPEQRKVVQQMKEQIYGICTKLSHDYLKNAFGHEHEFLKQLSAALNPLMAKELLFRTNNESKTEVTNNLLKMVMSKSKGAWDNIYQLLMMIGFIYVNNEFIKKQFNGRTSCFYKQCDIDPVSHGIIIDSYNTGLSPAQMAFNSMPERVRMLNKVLTVADAGTQGRYMRRNLEHILCLNNRALGRPGQITQLMFGGDGFMVEHSLWVKIPHFEKDLATLYEELQQMYKFETETVGNYVSKFNRFVVDIFGQLRRDKVARAQKFQYIPFDSKVFIPVDISTIVLTSLKSTTGIVSEVEIGYNCNQLYCFIEDLKYLYFSDQMMLEQTPIPSYFNKHLLSIKAAILGTLTVENLKHYSPEQFNTLLNCIYGQLQYKLMPYGHVAGINTAQCYQQYFTQDMLDSIHKIGGKQARKTEIVRVKELFGNKEPEKEEIAPLFTIPVARGVSKEDALAISKQIKILKMSQLVQTWHVIFVNLTGRQTDMKNTFQAEMNPVELQQDPNRVTGWCVRMVFDKKAMLYSQLDISEVKQALLSKFDMEIFESTDQNEDIVLRCYICLNQTQANHSFQSLQSLKTLIDCVLQITVRGIATFIDSELIEKEAIEQQDGKLVKETRMYIVAEGVELIQLLRLRLKYPTQLVYDNIHCDNVRLNEIWFGKVAAQQHLVNELMGITGDKISQKHVELVASEMCRLPYVTQISGGGVTQRNGNDDLMQAATHKPIQRITKSAIEGKQSQITSLSSNLMVGQTPLAGTNYNQLVVNVQFY